MQKLLTSFAIFLKSLITYFRYNIRWYIAPIPIQKLILFLLQRSTIDFNVNVGSLFIPSLEDFAMIKTYIFILEYIRKYFIILLSYTQ